MKNKYVVYSKQDCQPCQEAEALLSQSGEDYTKLYLNKDFTILELLDDIDANVRSFPAITLNGEYIGGLKDLKESLK